MKKTVFASLSAIALAVIFVASATAQDWALTADIPFNFNAGDTQLPAGKYVVQVFVGRSLLIRSRDYRKTVIILSNAMETPRSLAKGKMVFNVYGDHYFLSSVSWPQGPSRVLPPTSVELQAAKNAEAKRKLEIASQ